MGKQKFWILMLTVFFIFSGFGFGGEKKEAAKKIETLNRTINEAASKGDLQKAIMAAEDALAIATKSFGENSFETAKAMNNVANLYMYAGHPGEAERLYKNSILIEVEEKGGDSLEAADSYYNLAMAYAMQKKYDPAGKMLNQALKIRTKELGASHPETLKVQKMLDEVWSQQKS